MKSGGTTVQVNEYDGLSRRIVRDETGGSGVLTHFYWNEDWQCVEERVGGSGSANKQYVWHPYYIDALAVSYDSGGVKTFYTHDANFNVTAAINASGTVVERYQYSPYGEATILDANFAPDSDNIRDIANEYLYTGRRLDPKTGLYQFRNRYYHAQLGRFVNRDPAGYADGFNLYAGYFATWGGTDPSGLGFLSGAWEFCKCGPKMLGGIGADALDTVKGIISLLTTDPRQTINDLTEAVEYLIGEIKQGNLGPAFCAGFPNICEPADKWDDLSFSDRCFHIGKVIPELATTIFAAGKIAKGPALVGKLKGLAKNGAKGAKDLGAAGRNFLKNGVAPRGQLRIKGVTAPLAGSIRTVNPGYGARGFSKNCVRCAIATEQRFRGELGAIARSSHGPLPISIITDHFGGAYEDVSGMMDIGRRLRQSGNGARGIVYGVDYARGYGHVWNVRIDNGVVRFLDSQKAARAGLGVDNFDNFTDFKFLLTEPGR